jgi:hypothetical protein
MAKRGPEPMKKYRVIKKVTVHTEVTATCLEHAERIVSEGHDRFVDDMVTDIEVVEIKK